MSNPLFQKAAGGANLVAMIAQLIFALKGKDPEKLIPLLMQRNPQFAQFVQSCKEKTPEQVAAEHGIDLNQFKGLF